MLSLSASHGRMWGDRGRLALILAAVFAAAIPVAQATADTTLPLEVRSLDGGGNNVQHPTWGQIGTEYTRVGQANYANGRTTQVGGPNPRYTSNRVFNDTAQNIFSERNVSQWGWTWGQFMDHVFGLAQGGGETSPIPFNSSDPLESFTNDLGGISFTRDKPAPGTGTSSANPREHVNTLSS